MKLLLFGATGMTDTDNLSRAMLRIARTGASRPVLENGDLNALGA